MGRLRELLAGASLKLRPALRNVVEPASQFGAGRHLPRPGVGVQFVFADTPWPDAIHEHSLAIGSLGRLVRVLDRNHPAASASHPARPWDIAYPAIVRRKADSSTASTVYGTPPSSAIISPSIELIEGLRL